MVGADFHFVEISDSGYYKLTDAYTAVSHAVVIDTKEGGKDDFEDPSSKDWNGKKNITYFRKLKTDDATQDKEILIGKNKIITAWGKGARGFHRQNFAALEVELEIGKEDDGKVDPTEPVEKFDFFTFHGIWLIAAWGGLNFFGYLSTRFLKHLPYEKYIHGGFSGTTTISTLVIIIISLKVGDGYSSEQTLTYNLHYILGIVLLAILSLQFLLGCYASYLITLKSRLETGFIHKFKSIHKFNGMFLTFFAYANILTGFLLHFPTYMYIPITTASTLVIAILVLEIYISVLDNNAVVYLLSIYQNKISNLPDMTVEQLKYESKNKKWVIYDNLICDVGLLVDYHPGGKNLITDSLYTDIGRYITGTQAYNTKFKAYNHKYMTYKYFLNAMAYAYLKDESYLIKKNNLPHFLNGAETDKIVLLDKKLIAEHTYEYKFKLDFISNEKENVVFAKFLPGHLWIGRHYAVSSKMLNKTRYYSICLSLDEKLTECYTEILNKLIDIEEESTVNEKSINSLFKNESSKLVVNAEYFTLYIKKYDFSNTLSKHINKLEKFEDNDLVYKGPIGLGLDLNKVLSGTHIVVAGGTGILPFIDLITYLLRYSIFKQNNTKLINEEFAIDTNFKLVVFASFSNEDNCIYREVCEKMEKLDLKNNQKMFRYFLRISNSTNPILKERWDATFMEDNLREYKDEVTKVMFSGPVGFMDSIRDAMLITGTAKKEQIYYI